LALKTNLIIKRVLQSKGIGNMNGLDSQAPLSLFFIGFNDMQIVHSNGWETSTKMTLETQEGITASEHNAHSCLDTWDSPIEFKCLSTQEVLIRTHRPKGYKDLWHPKDCIAP
jgi:hypothetical protein